jgi:hypothetical protein
VHASGIAPFDNGEFNPVDFHQIERRLIVP